jgi:hypothetical protein
MKKNRKILLIIILLTLTIRLFLAFSIPNFTYESYFHLKQVEHITDTGLPLYQDSLSYGGRTLIFLPAFQYFVSFFDLFLPLEFLAKLIPNLLFASLIILVYLISKKITQREDASLLSAFIAAFIPLLWQTNSFSPTHLFLPLSLLTIYSFMRLRQKKFIYLYLVSIILLSLTTSAAFLVITGLFLYILLSKLEGKRVLKAELELALFSLFLFLWFQFLFFKNALLTEGPGFIWQNIPSQIISQYFLKFSIFQSLILIGLIPLTASIYTIYKSLFQEKNKNIFLLFSLAISTILLLLLNLVEFKIALMFLGLILAIVFSQFYKIFLQYLKQTKLIWYKTHFLIAIIVLLILTSAYPSVSFSLGQQTPSLEETDAFLWIKENTPRHSTVLTTLKEGHLLNYLSQRKNLMDAQFSLIKNIEARFNNLNSLFVTKYQTQAIDLLNEYDINYIFFSPQAKKEYRIDNLAYIDKKCFELIHSNVVQIYRSKCQIRPIKH